MKCPHCREELKYRDRSDKTCPKCKKKFALEPRGSVTRLSDERLRRLVAKLSDGGKLRVTDEFLRHFVARKIAVPASEGGCLPVLLVSLFLAGPVPLLASFEVYWPIAVGVVLMIAALAWAFTRPTRPFPARDLIGADEFRQQLLPYRAVYGAFPDGLVLTPEVRALPVPARPGPLRAVVVTPSRAVIDLLRVNGVHQRLEIGLLCTGDALDADRGAVLERLRARPGLPILLLHDASPGGCLLVEDLPAALGLRPEHRILDMGLFPKRSILKKRLCLRRLPPPPEQLRRLAGRPALPPPGPDARVRAMRPKRAVLTESELQWLATGATTPVEALRPADLIKRVELAVARLVPAPETVARQFGFLSRPHGAP